MRQLLLATIVLSAGAMPAAGQLGVPRTYTPGVGPIASPAYPTALNLLRAGNPLYSNYYGLVRPELDFRRAIQNLQVQTTTNQQSIANLDTQGIPTTGHPTQFFNTSHYFFNRGGQGGQAPTTRTAAPVPQGQQPQRQSQGNQPPPSRKQ